MKIISWNCNMAFRKKAQKILSLKPDLLIVIECEQKELLIPHLSDYPYKEILWHGDNKHKGIAIINFTNYKLEIFVNYAHEYKYILPFKLLAPSEINLFVIWAMPHAKSSTKSYVGQIWAAINFGTD